MKRLFIYILCIAASLLAACTDDLKDAPEKTSGEEIVIDLSLVVTPEFSSLSDTRSITGGEVDEGYSTGYKVKDFWLLQYDSQNALVGEPQYVIVQENASQPVSMSVNAPSSQDESLNCFVIANTHKATLFTSANVPTLDMLNGMSKTITRESDLYQGNAASGKDLLMNGSFVLNAKSVSDPSIECKLYRNVAKLTVNISVGSTSGLNKITSLQVRSIPKNIYYTDQSNKDGLFPPVDQKDQNGDENFMDLPLETVNIVKGSSQSFIFYLPRNRRGENSDIPSALKKNDGAQPHSTYVQLKGIADNGHEMCYTFYLGKDLVRNFDVVPNYHYPLSINITSVGDPAVDSRVEDLTGGGDPEPPVLPTETKTLNGANSYIVSTSANKIYEVKIDRINEFWQSAAGDGSAKISAGTSWVAEVIWQDAPSRVINFVQNNKYTDAYEGKGIEPFKFCMASTARYSNVLIGVKLKNNHNYLWSWHIWITDFNPESEGRQKYENGPWSAEYADKVIMDRNLGALSNAPGSYSFGLYYQFGRKDPFPGTRNIYDINGVLQKHTAPLSRPDTFKESVNHPDCFYATSSEADWAKPNALSNNQWNSLNSSDAKSIFDPCPPGWKVPKNGTWEYFMKFDGHYMFEKGGVDFPIPHEKNTWYPGTGYYDLNGKVRDQSSVIFNWSSTPDNVTFSFAFYVGTQEYNLLKVKVSSVSSRSLGGQIRCVKE